MAIKLTQQILFDGKTKGLKSRYYFNKKVDERRSRSYYPTEKEAKAALARYEKHLNQWGKVSETLSPDEAKDYTDACAKMPHAFSTLCSWVDHLLANASASATQGQGAIGKLSAIIEKFLTWKKEMVNDGSKAKKGKRLINQETYDGIARDLHAFCRHFGDKHEAITPETFLAYFQDERGGAKTALNNYGNIKQFYTHAVAMDWLAYNPCDKVPATRIGAKPVFERAYFKVDTCRKFFEKLRDTRDYKKYIPYYALLCFAGVRPAEAKKITLKDFNFEAKKIYLPAEKTKTRTKAILSDLEENFWTIFNKYKHHGIQGPASKTLENALHSLTAWKHDICRHSFCTYHYAKYTDVQKTIRITRHSEAMFRQHYCGAFLEKKDGEAYFSITI